MSGTIKRYYRLVDYKTNAMGEKITLLTQNRDKAATHYKSGGVVQAGYMQEYSNGKKYPWGKWETHTPDVGKEKSK